MVRPFIVKANVFNQNGQPKLDKRGNPAIYLEAYNGTLPANARVMSGTSAVLFNVQPGKFYVLEVFFTGKDPRYGDQFTYKNHAELSAEVVFTKEFLEAKVTVALPKEKSSKDDIIAAPTEDMVLTVDDEEENEDDGF